MDSTRKQILQWAQQGRIRPADVQPALAGLGVLPDAADWLRFLQVSTLWLGTLSLAFSAIFLVAYNWDSMGRFGRFFLLEILILVSVAGYRRLDSEGLPAKLLLLTAAMLTGGLLALYGQVYQTGADNWQLFAAWAVLILPWVLISRFPALWLLLISLLNLAIVLYFADMPGFFMFVFTSDDRLLWPVFLFNGLCWAAWDISRARFAWLDRDWPVRLLATVSGTAITTLMSTAAFTGMREYTGVWLAYPVFIALVYYFYRVRRIDLYMLAGLCLSAIVSISSLFLRFLVETLNSVGAYYLMTAALIIMAGSAGAWLRKLRLEQQSAEAGDG